MIFVHIAGTNGKGSVAEYISNIITASGASCGCFTSPHLFSPIERMRIDDVCISQSKLNALLHEVETCNLAINATLFAKYTAAALLWFKRKNIDYAVIETGLGGRLDPTNVIKADIVVLTPISFDHTRILGNSIQEIAAEKCGIIKSREHVICAQQHDEAQKVIEKHCADNNASLFFIEDINIISCTLNGQVFLFQDNEYQIQSIGEKQPENAALAVSCAQKLGIEEAFIVEGLQNTKIKRRTEYVKGNPPMIIDGAHNPSSISMMLETLNHHFASQIKVLLFACMDDKDYISMIELMRDAFIHVIVVSADIMRGANVHTLQELFSKHTPCQIENDIPSAVKKAKSIARKHNALLVICGSLYLAGSKHIKY